jgi:hypothetical protein
VTRLERDWASQARGGADESAYDDAVHTLETELRGVEQTFRGLTDEQWRTPTHGMDLTDAIGAESIATLDGIAVTAAILDELLARRTVAGRPPDLADDVARIRAASGRTEPPDPRLPLIG